MIGNYLALLISIVVSLLITAGAAAALHHVGCDHRQYKDHERHLDTNKMPKTSKAGLALVGLLVLGVAGVAFYRVWSEGRMSGLDNLALLLALLVALVMLVSAWLAYWIAFRDGTPEQDDLKYYSRLVRRHLKIKHGYDSKIADLEGELATHVGRSQRHHPSGSTHTTNGVAVSKRPLPESG